MTTKFMSSQDKGDLLRTQVDCLDRTMLDLGVTVLDSWHTERIVDLGMDILEAQQMRPQRSTREL